MAISWYVIIMEVQYLLVVAELELIHFFHIILKWSMQ